MKKPKAAAAEPSLDVSIDIRTAVVEFCVLGRTPLMMNRMPEKVIQGFLLPAPKMNEAERAGVLKHDPLAEFRSSVYRHKDNDHKTRLRLPAEAFKSAITDVAVDIPGAFKAQVGRLVSIDDINVDIYGIPQLDMRIVRQAGIAKTPDVRTRAYLPEWACKVSVRYVVPLLKHITIQKLFAAAGVIIGVGDGRPQKGKLTYGQFELVDEDDKRWAKIAKIGGRKAQDAALASPVCSSQDTETLLAWYSKEVKRRSSLPPDAKKPRRAAAKNGNGSDASMLATAAAALEERYGEGSQQ